MKIKVGEKLPSVEFFTLDDNKAVQKINTSSLFKSQKAILI
jgi:peroxiredoxin